MMKIPGFVGAIIEISLYALTSTLIYTEVSFDPITHYWLTFTTLTGFWEAFYIFNHVESVKSAKDLLETESNVWTNRYPISIILPWNFSIIFYGEYGAYADREYMTEKDDWSRLIEGTHALFCGLLSFLALTLDISGAFNQSDVMLSSAMGAQLMNSILYMGEYALQTKNKDNVNYNRDEFPLGYLWSKRPFMYINAFWTLMPMYVIIRQFV